MINVRSGTTMALFSVAWLVASFSPLPLRASEEIRILAGFGTSSFTVDSGAVSGPYQQDASGIKFGPSVNLGDTVGGRTAAFNLSASDLASLGLILQVDGAPEPLPFSVGVFNESEQRALFQVQTAGVGASPAFVPLVLTEGDPNRIGRVDGLQFTWDGSGRIDVVVSALAKLGAAPQPEPTPTPQPSPTPAPSPDPSPGPSPAPAPEGITLLKLLPPGRTVKAGKAAKLMVMVGNNSTQTQIVTVTFSSSNSEVAAPAPLNVTVRGKKSTKQKKDRTGRSKFTVPIPASATGSTVITASVGGLSSTSTLTIKAGKK